MRPFGTFTYITQGPTGLHPRLKKCVLNQTTTTYVHVRSQSCIYVCHVYTYIRVYIRHNNYMSCNRNRMAIYCTYPDYRNCHDFLSNKIHSHQNNYTLYLNSQHPRYLIDHYIMSIIFLWPYISRISYILIAHKLIKNINLTSLFTLQIWPETTT